MEPGPVKSIHRRNHESGAASVERGWGSCVSCEKTNEGLGRKYRGT